MGQNDMVSGDGSSDTAHDLAGDLLISRARRLFGFLREIQSLKSQPVRTVEQYESGNGVVVWLHDVPEHPAVASALTHDRPAPEAPLLIVDRVPPVDPPELPAELEPWLDAEQVMNPDNDPLPAETRIDGDAVTRFDEQEERQATFEIWRSIWKEWASEERDARRVRQLYTTLFKAGERFTAAPEELDLVLGVGLLSWRPEARDVIRRHSLVAPVTVDFAEDTGRITVQFPEGFEGFEVEVDMLDASQRPDPLRLQTFTDEVTAFEGHPLDREALDPLLRRFANIIRDDGMFTPSVEPGTGAATHPVVSIAPAFILRKRSNEGLVRIYNTIDAQLAASGVVPLGIRQVIDVVEGDDDRDHGEQGAAPTEAFLPLAANDQQLQIIARVDSAYHTVVQGPPGTGKTHTIANLVSHLLAKGQRVLVTAQTDRALRELQDKLPAEIAQLTVSVVGRSRADLADLRVAVESIGAHASSYDPESAAQLITQLDTKLDDLRRDRSKLEGQLLETRRRETDQRSFEGSEGTLAEIARSLDDGGERHRWLASFDLDTTEPAPISNAEAIEWLTLLRDPELQQDEAESRTLPALDDVPDPEAFERMVDNERTAAEAARRYGSIESHPAYPSIAGQPPDQRSELRSRVLHLADTARELSERNEEWISEALGDILDGRQQLWERRHDELQSRLEDLDPIVKRLGTNPMVNVEGPTTADLVPLAEDLLTHLEAGGRLGGVVKPRPVRAAAPLMARVTVDGLQPTTPDRLRRFLDWVRAENDLDAIEKLWPATVAIPEEDTHFEQLAWHETEHHQLRRVMTLAADLVTEETRLDQLGVPKPNWSDLEGVRSFASIVDAVIATEEASQHAAPVESLQAKLATLARGLTAADATKSLAAAVTERDPNAYRAAHERLFALLDTLERSNRRSAITDRISASTRSLAGAVLADRDNPQWETMLGGFVDAWDWHRLDNWLEDETLSTTDHVQHQLKVTEDRIRATITELTSAHAWRLAVDRLGQRERESLAAYALAVRQLGKGTGRYAHHRRLEARKALKACRSAVPAWIMPTYRIAETLDIDPDIFDVVIIDEASQAGLEATYLQYLAPRIIVVGDHHQVSPAGVGIEVQKLIDLTHQYLFDMDHQNIWQSPRVSFFDLARIKYGHMISLREHFRCVPEIIGFSNQLVYEPDRIPLIPLRQFGVDRLTPIQLTHVADGYEKGTTNKINPPEAEAIVDAIEKCCSDPQYDGKTMGVISLTGKAQADHIEQALLERLGPNEFRARDLRCGDAADFQGSERDVICLSMVAAPRAEGRITPLTADMYIQRFNVAGSRAKDQMWLFHSVTLDDLANREDMRFALLNYCTDQVRQVGRDDVDLPTRVPTDVQVDPFESLFEQHVFNAIIGRGFMVQPQVPVYNYRIDLVVIGGQGRIAVECDGDSWHGADRFEADMARQRDLERVGWTFFRIRASAFYRDPEDALAPLWDLLTRHEIRPAGWVPARAPTPEDEPANPTDEVEGLAMPPPVIDDLDPTDARDTFPAFDDVLDDVIGDQPASIADTESLEPEITTTPQVPTPADARPITVSAVVARHPQLALGTRVTHPSMGEGKIIYIALTAEGFHVTVAYDSGERAEYSSEEMAHTGWMSWAEPAPSPVIEDADAIPVPAAPQTIALATHVAYQGVGLPDPRSGSLASLCAGLEAIVAVEGPVTADRAYQLFIKGAGFDRVTRQVRSALNVALTSIRSKIEADEFDNPLTNWPQRVLRLPGTPPVVVRELGMRDFYQVPLNEIRALMEVLHDGSLDEEDDAAIKRRVLDSYDLVRHTAKVDQYLGAALRL